MPVPINHSGNLRKQFLDKQLITTKSGSFGHLTQEQKLRVKKHITRWRRNWDLFAKEVLQIKLYPLQEFSLHMMGVAHEYNEIATRGSGRKL